MLGASKRVLPPFAVMEKVKRKPQQRGAPVFPSPAFKSTGSHPSPLHLHPALPVPTLLRTPTPHDVPVMEKCHVGVLTDNPSLHCE